jgi:lysophospholipase L1-like esterase
MKRSIYLSIYFSIAILTFGVFFLNLFVNKVSASASLTISSASLASDGRALTVNIGNVSGSLSPATGVTGFTVKLAGSPLEASTTVSSASTVTINLATIILSGQTITLDLATSPTSNLTDTGSNTPQGQTNVAITNSSTQQGTTTTSSNSNLYYFAKTTSSNNGTHNFIQMGGDNHRLDTVVNGTDLDAQLYPGSYQITVDGSTTSKTVSGSNFNWVSLFSGKVNTAHTVSIVGTYIEKDNALRIVAPTGAALSAPAGYGTFLPISQAPFSTYIQLDGGAISADYGSYGSAYNWQGDSMMRFNAAVTDIYFWGYQGSGKIVVYQDGVEIANFIPTGASIWGLMHIATGLDSGSHLYEIAEIEPSDPVKGFYVYGLMLSGGTGLVSTKPAEKTGVLWYGDSIVAESGSPDLVDKRLGDLWLATRPLNLNPIQRGIPGWTVSTQLRNAVATQVTTISPKPQVIFLEGGVNDQRASVTIGNTSTAGTFAGDMKTMITSVATGLPATSTIFVRAILPNSSTNSTNRSLYTAAQQAAVNAYMAGNPTVQALYINTDNWISATPNVNTDSGGLHLSMSGYAKVANREIPLINGIVNGTSYTVSGPSNGTSSQASTNFTVALPGGATFTGDQTITIADGGNGGTFTPSVGSTGVSSVTVTPATSTTSFTFTYNAATAGTKTLTFTNGQNWTDSTSTAYVANSGVTTPTVTTTAASSITGTTTTLNGSITAINGADASQSGFAYGTSSDLSITIATTTLGAQTGTITFSSSVSSLSPYTTYYFRAYATNSAGTGYGTIQSFTTLDITAPTVSMTAPANSATVSGSSVSLAATASDNVAVAGVQFKLDTSTNIGSEDTTSTYGVTWDSTAAVDGPHTLIAVARDAAGNYATSTAVTVTVDNTAPVRSSGAPTTTLAYGTTGTTISLATNESATCKYSTSSSTAYSSMTAFSTTGTTNHSSAVTGLSDGNTYTYYVKCSDEQSNINGTNYSFSFSIDTDTVAPVITSVSASSLTTTGATITWTTDENATSQVVYGTSTSYGLETTSDATPVQSHSVALSGLTASTLYHYAVVSTDALGNTATSSDKTFTTTSVSAGSVFTGTAPQTSARGSVGYLPSYQFHIPSLPQPVLFLFDRDLQAGNAHAQVKLLQQYLNTHGFIVSKIGAGSVGNETTIFGPATKAALIKFQKAVGIKPASGYFGPITRKFMAGLK